MQNEQQQDPNSELTVHRLSRWQDKQGRLFVVYGFGYGVDPVKPHLGRW